MLNRPWEKNSWLAAIEVYFPVRGVFTNWGSQIDCVLLGEVILLLVANCMQCSFACVVHVIPYIYGAQLSLEWSRPLAVREDHRDIGTFAKRGSFFGDEQSLFFLWNTAVLAPFTSFGNRVAFSLIACGFSNFGFLSFFFTFVAGFVFGWKCAVRCKFFLEFFFFQRVLWTSVSWELFTKLWTSVSWELFTKL